MNEAVLTINNIYVYSFGLLLVLSYLWGAFVFYKKSLESHFEDFHIFDSIVVSAFWAFILGRVFFVAFNWGTFWNHFPRILLLANYPGLDRWGGVIGVALGLYLSVRKLKTRFLDWFDLACLGLLSGGAIFLSGLFFMTRDLGFLILSVVTLAAYLLLWNVEEKYRTFDWYRGKRTSARSGLVTGASIAFWGLSSILGELVFKKNNWPSSIWGILLFVCGFVLVYIRSGRTVGEDLKNIFKHGQK